MRPDPSREAPSSPSAEGGGVVTTKPFPGNAFRAEVRPGSFVIGEQVRTISTRRLIKSNGSVPAPVLAQVEGIVRRLLGL
jgi:mRNA-degrading endonuclease toxin of MazEF toxin-antitoxin module